MMNRAFVFCQTEQFTGTVCLTIRKTKNIQMKKISLFLLLGFGILFNSVRAQELIKPQKLNVKYDVSGLGDAHIEASMTLDASQWDNYKRLIGNNPDILKRQMERTFPGYFLQNFNYKEDVMNRGWTLSFDALGLGKVNSRGQWQVDLNSKNPDITKISDRNYVLTSNYSNGGTLMQEIDNINFPDVTSDIKQDKDALGKAIFTYSSSAGGGYGGWLSLISGAILFLAGIGLLIKPDRA